MDVSSPSLAPVPGTDVEIFHRACLSVATATTLQAALTAVVQHSLEMGKACQSVVLIYRDDARRGTITGNTNAPATSGSEVWLRVQAVAGETRVEEGVGTPREAAPQCQAPGSVLEPGEDLDVPLISRERIIGRLQLRAFPGEKFDERIRRLLHLFAEQAGVVVSRARLFEQLQRAKREWEATFDGMVDGVYICRADGMVLRANRALAEMLGLRIADILRRHREQLHEGLPDYQMLRAWTRVDNSPPDLDLQTCEFRFDAPERIFIETMFALRPHRRAGEEDPTLDEGRRICIVHEVTEQRRLQEQLVQSEKLAALGELLSGVAHELNNPLATVVGYAQLLEGNADLAPKVSRRIHNIHHEARRASHIVQNLLAFARRSEPEKTHLDVNEVLDTLVQMRSYQLQAENVRVVTEYGLALPPVRGDATQLQQVFLNIINNASQAVSEWRGGGEIHISTQAVLPPAQPGVLISIADNGPGIAPEHLRRVFDPFFTTKGVGRGTGLGMSISLRIVNDHGGRIWAESRVGQGARFMVELPAASGEAPVEIVLPVETPGAVPQSRILVIDDEEPVVMLVSEILAMDGHQATPAFNGAEALALLQTHDFDLIISDVRMPAVGGPTFFEILQTTRPDLLSRVIFVTGDTVSNSTQSFIAKAGRPMLAKPFDPERLRALVADTLRQNAAEENEG